MRNVGQSQSDAIQLKHTNRMMKQTIHALLAFMVSVGMMPVAPATVIAADGDLDTTAAKEADITEGDLIPEEEEVTIEEQEVLSTSDMLHYVLDVRWGNVEGDVSDREKADFSGSISVPATGHVTLRQKLLFENHDELTSEQDPVSWDSLIYGHWDGIRVAVSAQAGDLVSVETAQGTYSDSAQAIFESEEPIIYDVGSGKEIVLRARPLERRGFFMAVGWGHPNRHEDDREEMEGTTDVQAVITDGTRVNFTGTAAVGGNSVMKAVRPLRFERLQGDKISQYSRQLVKWRSIINGGMDGILLRLHPDRTNDASDSLTVSFTELGFEMSWPLVDLYHSDSIEVTVPVPGHDVDHVLILKRWRHPHGKLIRGVNGDKVYYIEGDLRRHVISTDAFARAGLSWDDVEVVDDEDVDTYVDGNPFGYDDGMLIKGSGPKVWVIAGGKRRHIADPAAFARLGYDWDNLIEIPDTDVEQYEETDELSGEAQAPEGALLRVEGDPKVYVIEGGRRRHVPNPDVFAARKLRWTHVQVVDGEVVDELPVSDDLNYPNGAVVQALDGRVFEIEDGERHHLKSARELLLRGHTWQSVHRDETGVLIDKFEDGDDVELLDDVPTL